MSRFLNVPFVSLIATVIGVAVSVWIYRTDLSSKSLAVVLKSQTPIAASALDALKDVQVVHGGKPVPDPVLSLVTVTNDGSRPVATADFESPILIDAEGASLLVAAQVTARQPADLKPLLTVDGRTVSIAPMLLNPGDEFTLALLTAGKPTALRPAARVSGVSNIRLTDSSRFPPILRHPAFYLLLATLCFAASDAHDIGFLSKRRLVVMRRRAAILSNIIIMLIGMLAFLAFYITAELSSFWYLTLWLAAAALVGSILGAILNRGASKASVADAA
ncbi:hypothetical protein [Paucibacter sp. M5-1]|uniref:hypothetical protein n=1 Tax=Paucibacter sp. M5-1 TaxID=3015998 RepID=UPI0022B93B90|nr:hypothetical protein [Paucibacter sp. M5-1]MCZ7881082.1 hypothetical protein [Paucibacter sp. M5-1]